MKKLITRLTALGFLGIIFVPLANAHADSAYVFDGTGLDPDGTFHVDMAPPENIVEQYILNEYIWELTQQAGITSGGEWG